MLRRSGRRRSEPAFDALTDEQLDRAALAFADLITAPGDPVGRLPGSAVLGVGTV